MSPTHACMCVSMCVWARVLFTSGFPCDFFICLSLLHMWLFCMSLCISISISRLHLSTQWPEQERCLLTSNLKHSRKRFWYSSQSLWSSHFLPLLQNHSLDREEEKGERGGKMKRMERWRRRLRPLRLLRE